jgi:hypothetical protein
MYRNKQTNKCLALSIIIFVKYYWFWMEKCIIRLDTKSIKYTVYIVCIWRKVFNSKSVVLYKYNNTVS